MKLLVSQTASAGGVVVVPDVPAAMLSGGVEDMPPDVPPLPADSPVPAAGFDPLAPLVPLVPVVEAPVPAFGAAEVLLPAVPVDVVEPAAPGVMAAGC